MARPKSYTDEDVIRIVTQLCSDGRKPTGWLIKEALGRGKIASIQADLDRLIAEGKLPEIQMEPSGGSNSELRIVETSYELPVELQDMLSLKELELGKILREMTIGINDKAHAHYETLIAARIRELDAQSDVLAQAKATAELDKRDMEIRLQKQVENNEVFEDQIENLENRLTNSKTEKSDLVQTINQMTDSLSKLTEKADQQYALLDGLRQTISDKDKAHAAMEVKLEHAVDEAKKSKLQLTDLLAHYEVVKVQLNEKSTLLKSTQESLNQSNNQISAQRKENTELTATNRLLEKNLEDAESEIALLHEQKQHLETDFFEGENTKNPIKEGLPQ
ncbi:hypothetical protein PTW35_25855 (plasmid) [Photobacterium sp. DA100]|uniref:DNA-binding protein n=1 Tax=Photobacterium sp. DA100 TaxID=3027472 RepID=UPI0024787204|nr:DNA-binding protein [Photobacterium sp. DA100]WEM44683.1 hypothetical protein PTW35_25855 [Photobacterium sp. DA100]